MKNLAPLIKDITLEQLNCNPYPIYKYLRHNAPVARIKSVGRTFITKAEDTRYIKDNPVLFSSNDRNTPMKRAFWAHTLMRKDGNDHLRDRMAMAPAYVPKVIQNNWMPRYEETAREYVDKLPKDEIVDFLSLIHI